MLFSAFCGIKRNDYWFETRDVINVKKRKGENLLNLLVLGKSKTKTDQNNENMKSEDIFFEFAQIFPIIF